MRVSRLQDCIVMCEFRDCEKTAVFLLQVTCTKHSGGRLLMASCEKHAVDFIPEEPQSLLRRVEFGRSHPASVTTDSILPFIAQLPKV